MKRWRIDPFSTEDYISSMEDNMTRTKIGRAWNQVPILSRPNGRGAQKDLPVRKIEKPHPKLQKCGSKSHLANYLPKKRINKIQVFEKVEPLKE
ncbi:hypothetical protein O181_022460 [Austropuccinia psidii MF-1]|uniref:Uncharacterized protein n=1 Tax=Austropuccinia psidii MF-1 TaxID=1389203 RepID=A0A9Q3CHF1_9BASI|nr:hypothetical protein [Austropuccinia psidii MF-1]